MTLGPFQLVTADTNQAVLGPFTLVAYPVGSWSIQQISNTSWILTAQ